MILYSLVGAGLLTEPSEDFCGLLDLSEFLLVLVGQYVNLIQCAPFEFADRNSSDLLRNPLDKFIYAGSSVEFYPGDFSTFCSL